ncbi:MAG: hypothetical protein ACRDF8_11905, partial [Chloroflexota bacterium]
MNWISPLSAHLGWWILGLGVLTLVLLVLLWLWLRRHREPDAAAAASLAPSGPDGGGALAVTALRG